MPARIKRLCLSLCVPLAVSGCASLKTLNAAQANAPVVYAGTCLDWYAIQGGCCAQEHFGTSAPLYPEADLPASLLLDTLLLPITLPTALGFNVQTHGGI